MLSSLVLVTGLAGKGMLSDSMQLYLLQRFAAGANIRPVVFNTINFLLEDIAPCPPNLNDSALELLQLLQAERQKEVEAQKETEGLETAPDNVHSYPASLLATVDILTANVLGVVL